MCSWLHKFFFYHIYLDMPLSFLLEVVEGIPDRPLKIHSVQLKHRSVVNSLE